MAFVAADWSITRATGNIRYIWNLHGWVAPTYTTGIELHRALQDFADDSVDGWDDELSIIDETPSDRWGVDTNITLLWIYNIDDASSEYLYDTSITQGSWWTQVIYDWIQVFWNSNTIQVIQDWALLSNDFWNEAKMIAAVADVASSTSHRFLVKVRTAGADIDGRRLIWTQRELGTAYTEFTIGWGTNRWNNVLALNANTDINNTTAAATIATWVDIVNDVEWYTGIDADGNTTNEFYYSDWELWTRSKNEFYERSKWIQREWTAETLYWLAGDLFRWITHEIDIDTNTWTFAAVEAVSWTGWTGQMLAIDSTTAWTKMWIQLLTGVIPTDGQVITGVSTATAAVNVTVSKKVLSATFIWVSTGSAIIGAFWLGIWADDLSKDDLVTDLTWTANTPPNNVTFTQANLVIGDAVLIWPEDGAGGLEVDQFALSTTLIWVAETSVVTTVAIPTDTPSSGTIRIQNDAGRYVLANYTSYTWSTFTITAQDFSSENATAWVNVFISYIDKVAGATSETFTVVYLASRTLFIRVRNATAQIKTFESTWTLGSGWWSSTTGRISDA